MKVIIYDMDRSTEEAIRKKYVKDGETVTWISDDGTIKNCIGCFQCFVKTPGRCVLKDNYNKMGETLGHADEVIIISECIYGTYSTFVRNTLDRSLSLIHADFTYRRNHEMHHKLRYHNNAKYRVYFYGDCTDEEKATARKIVDANTLNFGGKTESVEFYKNVEDLLKGRKI